VVDFETVISTADIVTLHVPLTERTRHLIDARALARMKQGSFLVNVARGGVVDEAALLTALQEGHLAGAALDVHEREGEGTISPFAELPNVVLTPHIGAMAADSQREIGMRVLELVDAFTRGNLDEVTTDGELVA
jgi:phosphoglycerate dehydrogenase-like enzyme